MLTDAQIRKLAAPEKDQLIPAGDRTGLYLRIRATGRRTWVTRRRVGGAWRDIPDDEVFKRMVKSFINERIPRALADLENLLNRNRIFIDRLTGIGVISREDAIAWSLTGPMARGSGVRRDVRKDEPYLCYAANWDGEGAEPVKFT